MQADVDAALAAKLTMLFPPREDTFLAFPATGEAFSAADLDLFDTGEGDVALARARRAARAQFARVLNQVLDDDVVARRTDRMLWDEYERVLEQAQVAASTLDETERRRLTDARAVLAVEVDVDGTPTTVHSPVVVAYHQHKEAYESVERTRLDERITAETAGGEALAAWRAGRGAELDGAVAAALSDWATLGHRDVVEQAQATVASLTGRNPDVRRRELLTTFDSCREVELVSGDAEGVLSTFYSPSDAVAPEQPWAELRLTQEEIPGLLAAAPAELRARVGGGAEDVLDITVEYADVAVLRPWFDPGFFDSRAWRLPPDDPDPVSDGAAPRTGRIPGYVTSMIVARRVTVVREGAPPPAGAAGAQKLSVLARARLRSVAASPEPLLLTAVSAPAAPVGPAATALLTVRDHRRGRATGGGGVTVTATPAGRRQVARLQQGFAVTALTGRVRAVRDHRTPTPERPPTSSTEVLDLDGVLVLAYRCRRLPRSPDPDPDLDWTGDGPRTGTGAGAWPLPAGHVLGATRGDSTVHTGVASAEDRALVMTVQRHLVRHGATLDADGDFGPLTAAAVTDFQHRAGLPADGRVDRATWEAVTG